ncbi:hypothetical protein AAKU64_003132 [Undibacterium sp. GrIS 1.8]|uniref:hypothetical protein n=1 Tax=unclassified Undibacterium TaxID=2630295 RepID=UPI003397034E
MLINYPSRPSLPYVPLQKGTDFWILDNALPDPDAVRQRILTRHDWQLGFPHSKETWPGKRVHDALTAEEMAPIEQWVKTVTGKDKIWVTTAPDGQKLDHNVGQMVGATESGARPHTDSRVFCRYAAVIYLTPNAPEDAGTSIFRLRYPDGTLSGNICPPPHRNLLDALKVRFLPPQAWQEDCRLKNIYNRMVLYKANLVHSATAYFGSEDHDKRLTTVFFWMAED